MKISFLMSVYNKTELLHASINSILNQDFEDYEILIWDDSDNNPDSWNILTEISKIDSRIRLFRDGNSYGWPKASSILLEEAKGDYVTFIAADDFLVENSISKIIKDLDKSPDVLMVSFKTSNYDEIADKVNILGDHISQYREYGNENVSERIYRVMVDTYYNSFFHYLRRDFLKEAGIDFFDHYMADCATMSCALARANSIIVTNELVYILTLNTSQTVGKYTWNMFDHFFAEQWRVCKEVFDREGFEYYDVKRWISIAILNNLFGTVDCLVNGNVRDIYMKPVEKTNLEIAMELQKILASPEVKEMLSFYGEEGAQKLLSIISKFDFSKINCQ